ncbi:MAG TPA: branched-chain amino acid ABC transporter permease [Stellaceae bacterium]|jgi:branched-chain amino acid transport system permease protein|nr:branched-chain amino acid ABC transporter permease [Stellaceae bacterium]
MRSTSTLAINLLRVAFAASVVALAAAPLLFGATEVVLLTEFMSMLVLAIMWNLLAGYADIVTVGQHAFVGVGAYAFFGFTALWGLDTYLSIPLAGAVALIIAVPAMLLVFRLRTAYLAIGTWVVAEVLMLGAGKLEAWGGGSGTSLPISIVLSLGHARDHRLAAIYWLAFALAAVALIVTYVLLRSRIGIGLTAMRDNEEGAAAIGVNITRARILCFLGTAPFLGMAGAIVTLQKLRVSPPASFSITDFTVFIIFNVVIGGIGSFEGPIIGTIVYFVLRQYLAELGTWNLILLGSFSIILILIDRRGLWGLFRRLLSDDVIPTAHKPAAAPKAR